MRKYFLPTIFIVCLLVTAITPNLKANDKAKEKFSPWAAWRKGFSSFEEGKQKGKKGKHKQALEEYQKAYQYYTSIKQARPGWNQQIIINRIKMSQLEISKLKKLLDTGSPTK
jgi:hypothetical protein